MRLFSAHVLFLLRLALRDPTYLFMTICLPAGIYWFFAVPESVTPYIASYLIGSFSAFAFLGVLFFQNAIALSHESRSPWIRYQKTLPGAQVASMAARCLTSMLFAGLAACVIYGLGRVCTPTELTPLEFSHVLLRLVLGGFPFLLLAYAAARIFSPRAITPAANFLYLSLSFAGGLWKPPDMLSDLLQNIAWKLPTYHYGRVVWDVIPEADAMVAANVIYLACFTLGLLALFPIWAIKTTSH